jgi:hypothetical protein
MNTARFITPEEVHPIVTELFSVDKTITRQLKTEEELDTLKNQWMNLMIEGEMKISVVFDESGSPIAMYTARLIPRIAGWWVGATKIKNPSTNFHTSAKIMVPGLELMIDEMEKLGYYKWWMVAPENHHNIRNNVMKKYSPALNRYEWFDEAIIPAGARSDTPLFEMHRLVVHWTDVLVRMFVLKQEHRYTMVKDFHQKSINANTGPTPSQS